jgi:hypothetical protein
MIRQRPTAPWYIDPIDDLVRWADLAEGDFVPPHTHLQMLLETAGWTPTVHGWVKKNLFVSHDQLKRVVEGDIIQDASAALRDLISCAWDIVSNRRKNF